MTLVERALRALSMTLAALFVLLGAPRAAEAKAFEIRDETWEGCSELYDLARAELGQGRVLPRADLDWSELTAGDAILVMHPERAINYDKLTAFLSAGGRVAILDDYGAADHTLSPMGVYKAPAPAHPVEALRGNAELAIAEPIVPHPALSGVERIVVNHPTALRSVALTPVLRIANAQGPDAVLAFAGEPDPERSRGGGKVFVMGDPSVLINHMLRYPGNRAFAVGLVRFLTRQGEGGTGKLYVVANDFGEVGAFGNIDLAAELASRLETLRTTGSAALADGF
jgi:hypothetical protein